MITFRDVVEKEIVKSQKMGAQETLLFIPAKPVSSHHGKFDNAESVLQDYNDAGYSVRIRPSKTEHAKGNYVYISNAPIEEVEDE